MKNRYSIGETVVESIYNVMPEHSNPLGILHGGMMMSWLISTATMTAARFSRGSVVLGALDEVSFINPVKVGDSVYTRAWLEYVGTSSMEIGVAAYSENVITGERKLTTTSHMVFIAVDERGEPREILIKIEPADDNEKEINKTAKARREARQAELRKREEIRRDVSELGDGFTWRIRSSRIVFQDDALYGKYMAGGRLLKLLDELAGTLASKYCKDIVVTASVDKLFFYNPILVGDILNLDSVVAYVGRTSIDVGVKIITENPYSGRKKHAGTTFFTFVRINQEGKPVEVPRYEPTNEREKKLWEERRNRRKILRELSKSIEDNIRRYEMLSPQ